MKKLFVMAAMALSSVGAFAQQAAGTTTLQPKVGLNVATIGDNDWKAGFAAGAVLLLVLSSPCRASRPRM